MGFLFVSINEPFVNNCRETCLVLRLEETNRIIKENGSMFTHRFLRLAESLKKVGISPSKLLEDKFLQFHGQLCIRPRARNLNKLTI